MGLRAATATNGSAIFENISVAAGGRVTIGEYSFTNEGGAESNLLTMVTGDADFVSGYAPQQCGQDGATSGLGYVKLSWTDKALNLDNAVVKVEPLTETTVNATDADPTAYAAATGGSISYTFTAEQLAQSPTSAVKIGENVTIVAADAVDGTKPLSTLLGDVTENAISNYTYKFVDGTETGTKTMTLSWAADKTAPVGNLNYTVEESVSDTSANGGVEEGTDAYITYTLTDAGLNKQPAASDTIKIGDVVVTSTVEMNGSNTVAQILGGTLSAKDADNKAYTLTYDGEAKTLKVSWSDATALENTTKVTANLSGNETDLSETGTVTDAVGGSVTYTLTADQLAEAPDADTLKVGDVAISSTTTDADGTNTLAQILAAEDVTATGYRLNYTAAADENPATLTVSWAKDGTPLTTTTKLAWSYTDDVAATVPNAVNGGATPEVIGSADLGAIADTALLAGDELTLTLQAADTDNNVEAVEVTITAEEDSQTIYKLLSDSTLPEGYSVAKDSSTNNLLVQWKSTDKNATAENINLQGTVHAVDEENTTENESVSYTAYSEAVASGAVSASKGVDTLTGGEGNDTFVVGVNESSVTANNGEVTTKIADYKDSGTDTIAFKDSTAESSLSSSGTYDSLDALLSAALETLAKDTSFFGLVGTTGYVVHGSGAKAYDAVVELTGVSRSTTVDVVADPLATAEA